MAFSQTLLNMNFGHKFTDVIFCQCNKVEFELDDAANKNPSGNTHWPVVYELI